jgi:hypothetical protein
MNHIGFLRALFDYDFRWFFVLIIPFWQIFKKAGFSPWFSVLMAIPVLNIVVLYFFAFTRWRVLENSK